MDRNQLQMQHFENARPNNMQAQSNTTQMPPKQSYYPLQVQNQSYQCHPSNSSFPAFNFHISNVFNPATNATFSNANPPSSVLTPPANPPTNGHIFDSNGPVQPNAMTSHHSNPMDQRKSQHPSNQSSHNRIESKQGYESARPAVRQPTEWEKRQAELQQKIQNYSQQHVQFVGTKLQQLQNQKTSADNPISDCHAANGHRTSATANANVDSAQRPKQRETNSFFYQCQNARSPNQNFGICRPNFGEDRFSSHNQTGQPTNNSHGYQLQTHSLPPKSTPTRQDRQQPFIESPPLSEGSSTISCAPSLSIDFLENSSTDSNLTDPGSPPANAVKCTKRSRKNKENISEISAHSSQDPAASSNSGQWFLRASSLSNTLVNSIYMNTQAEITNELQHNRQSAEQKLVVSEMQRDAARQFETVPTVSKCHIITPYSVFECQNGKAAGTVSDYARSDVLRTWWNSMTQQEKDLYYQHANKINGSRKGVNQQMEQVPQAQHVSRLRQRSDGASQPDVIWISDEDQPVAKQRGSHRKRSSPKKPPANTNVQRQHSVIQRASASHFPKRPVQAINAVTQTMQANNPNAKVNAIGPPPVRPVSTLTQRVSIPHDVDQPLNLCLRDLRKSHLTAGGPPTPPNSVQIRIDIPEIRISEHETIRPMRYNLSILDHSSNLVQQIAIENDSDSDELDVVG